MYRSMVDIQSATAEIRRGKKRRKKIETAAAKYSVRICYTGRPITQTDEMVYSSRKSAAREARFGTFH